MKKAIRHQRQEALAKEKRNRRITIYLVGAAALLLMAAAVLTLQSEPAVAAIDPDDAQQVALGEEIYFAQCASCHGDNLEGEANWQQPGEDGLLKAPPHDETGHTWHHGDDQLIDSIKRGGARLGASGGVSPMPAYDTILPDEEIVAVLAYIKSAWPADIRRSQAIR